LSYQSCNQKEVLHFLFSLISVPEHQQTLLPYEIDSGRLLNFGFPLMLACSNLNPGPLLTQDGFDPVP
jgi:hypothetical protein